MGTGFVLLWLVAQGAQAFLPVPRDFALAGAKVYPSPDQPAISNGVVVVRNGRIAAVGALGRTIVPAGLRVIDCAGQVVTAAFWNSHVHFTEPKWQNAASVPPAELARFLRDMFTRYGFTTVFDVGSLLENTRAIRDRIEKGEIEGPRIFTTGAPLVRPGGTPYYVKPFQLPELHSAEHAGALARQNLEAGADGIKLHIASSAERGAAPVAIPLDRVRAVTAEAHRTGNPVFAHPQDFSGWQAAVDGGVDILTHVVELGGRFTPAHIAAMKRSKMALIPTLKLFGPKPDLLDQVRSCAAAGGQILFGTDIGFLTDYDPLPEYDHMVKAGLDFRAILHSLTTAPAARFGQSADTGRIVPGLAADLVVLEQDPAVGISALTRVRYTFRSGRVVFDAASKGATR